MTVSVHKRRIVFFAVSVLVLVLIVFLFKAKYSENNITINGKIFATEVMDNDSLRQKGLSERSNMPDNNAMLFKFESIGERCFWMKDMKFAIDIIWLNNEGSISAIETNVQPDTYPKKYCHSGRSVLEFTAGQVEVNGLKIGGKLKL